MTNKRKAKMENNAELNMRDGVSSYDDNDHHKDNSSQVFKYCLRSPEKMPHADLSDATLLNADLSMV